MSKGSLKSLEEIAIIKASADILSRTLAEVAKYVKPGVTTLALDKIGEEYIRDNGGVPAFLGYGGFPNSLCISPNEQVVHGIPSKYELKEGDIISIDCGVLKEGYYSDSAYTFAVGEVSNTASALMKVTKECLNLGILEVRVGNRIGDIGYAIQTHAERHGYGVVRDLVGHGLGKELHEKPEVPNYGRRANGLKLEQGMVLAIEPMINQGGYAVKFWEDGWTVTTKDKKLSAHYEHTIAITDKGVEILTSFEDIEKVINK